MPSSSLIRNRGVSAVQIPATAQTKKKSCKAGGSHTMSMSGCSGTSGNASTEVGTVPAQWLPARNQQEQDLPLEGREGAVTEVAPAALVATSAESPQRILSPSGNPLDGHVQEPQFESSCSQRWHQRVTAALCVAGVTLSFVILALGLLFGGGLRRVRGPHNNSVHAQGASTSSANETSVAPVLPRMN